MLKEGLYLKNYRLDPIHDETGEDTDVVYDYQIVDVVVKTGDSEEEFYTTQKYKCVGKHSRSKELNKYRDDVGCENIIKKFAKQGIDAGDGRFGPKTTGYVDATKLPRDLEGVINLGDQLDPKISQVWKSIPQELKGNMNIKEFAEKYDVKMFKDYLLKKAAQKGLKNRVQEKQQEIKEGEVKE